MISLLSSCGRARCLRKLKTALIVIAALLVLTVAGILIRGSHRTAARTVRLSDGSVWRIEELFVGTNHQRWVGSNWQLPLAALPSRWAEKIARKPLYEKWPHTEPLLVIYSRFLTSAAPQLRLALRSTNLITQSNHHDTQTNVFGFGFTAWPRHATHFDFVWSSASEPMKPLGSLRIKNPAPLPPSEIRPARLAAESVAGGLTLKLTSMRLSTNPPHSTARVDLAIFEDGKPTENYAVSKWWLEDALGNRTKIYNDESQASWGPAHEIKMQLSQTLWAPELGWTFRGELVQRSGFNSNQIVVFTNVPLPSPTSQPSQIAANSPSGSLTLETHPKAVSPLSKSYLYTHPSPAFIIRFPPSTNIVPQIISVEGNGSVRQNLPAQLRAPGYALFRSSFEQDHGNVTCALVQPIPFTLTAVPGIE